MTTNNKISNLIYSQVPFFVKNDHPNFILFLEKYYEYLEQQGKLVDRSKNLPSFSDIDFTEDLFADILYGQFINLLPRNIIADKALVLKYAKDFYRSKGSEKSIRFLLEILFGINTTDFYYPKTDILRASDGKWFVKKSIRISKAYINNVETTDAAEINKFKSSLITGSISGATALVESVNTYYEAGIIVYELEISSVVKEFNSNELITAIINDEGVQKTLSADTFGGIISSVRLISGGSGYAVGTSIPVESNTGSGGSVIVSGATKGNISGIAVTYSGAGFVNGNFVLITGGGAGSGANANIAVDPSEEYHPNSYTLISSTIGLEANTTIGNAVYSNLSSGNVNTSIINAVDTFIYGNTGPVNRVFVLNPGQDYTSLPSLDIQADSRIRSLGILGRMEIIDGGENYSIGDTIEFINPVSCYGTGAKGEVSNVDANGAITEVKFVEVPGHTIGGSGYSNEFLPTTNVVSANGTNANISVVTILGDGETLLASTETIGKITELKIISGGSGYTTAPTLNLSNIGDGTAQATTEIITGTFTYPGRFINDDGMISSFNYLEDRDYYQNYSYVIRTNKPFSLYKKVLYDLVHPTGMKVFGEFDFINEDLTRLASGVTVETKTDKILYKFGNYYTVGNANGSIISINIPSHGFNQYDNVYVDFITGSSANIANINILAAGLDYKSGYITFANGTGSNANASIVVGDNGEITKVVVNDSGDTYSITDNIFANVQHLITSNIANINIIDGSEGYSNGSITFVGGSGRNANARINVNATGAIVNVTILNRGTGYESSDNISINTASLITYNVASISIDTSGEAYSNGYIIFTGGSGFNANASVTVNATGSIVGVTINNRGVGYGQFGLRELTASIGHLKTYSIGELQLIDRSANYSNGSITFQGGTGTGAAGYINVDQQGTITSTTLTSNGSNYSFGDIVYANVENRITSNIANVVISNPGVGYSNGFISFEGGSGKNANASVTVNNDGSIVSVSINDRGTAYTNTDVVLANVTQLLTYNVNSISIANSGASFSNGYIIFEGGSGRNANAAITVNSSGAITNVIIYNKGTGYSATDNVNAKITHLTSYNLSNVQITRRGSGYSNGFIIFTSTEGFGANARIEVNATGALTRTIVLANGTGYVLNGAVSANISHLGGTNGAIGLTFSFGNPLSANLIVNLAKFANSATLSTNLQKGTGTANIGVVLTSNTAKALLPVTLQKFQSNASFDITLQKGVGGANLDVNLQPEPLNRITDDIFIVNSANTNWLTIQHANSANIYGTSYVGTLT